MYNAYLIYTFHIFEWCKYNTFSLSRQAIKTDTKSVLKEDFLYLFAQRTRKEVISMPTIFPREEKAEALFDKIVKNHRTCKRLMDAFYEGIACDEDSGV